MYHYLFILFIISEASIIGSLKKFTTIEFDGKEVQNIMIDSLSDYNVDKRERSTLEKNVRKFVVVTGQTGKNVEMVSEIGEAGAHYIIDKTSPIITDITGNINSLEWKVQRILLK